MTQRNQAPVAVASAPAASENAAILTEALGAWQSPLLRYAAQLLRNRPDHAQDVVQEAFIRFHRALRNGKPIDNHQSWLYRVTHNLAIDHLRREQRFHSQDDMQATLDRHQTTPPPSEATGRREACALAVAELHELPELQQRVLLLKVMEKRTLQEIADLSGLSISTIHYHLGQGLRELNRRLKAKGVTSL